MTVIAPHDPISPELVLVSSPEAAQLARNALPAPAWWLKRYEDETGPVELAAVWLFCLAMTLGPTLLLLALRP